MMGVKLSRRKDANHKERRLNHVDPTTKMKKEIHQEDLKKFNDLKVDETTARWSQVDAKTEDNKVIDNGGETIKYEKLMDPNKSCGKVNDVKGALCLTSVTTEEQEAAPEEEPLHLHHKRNTNDLRQESCDNVQDNIMPDLSNNNKKHTGECVASTENCTAIAHIWEQIDTVCKKWSLNKSCPLWQPQHGWRVVNLFVSSTFTDFHAEREVIVKHVIPELNEWFQSKKIHLIECDLRWGVPKDANSEETIKICLDEIERCLDETGGHAFFLNLLGERYGWIPDLKSIDTDIVSKYDLINGMSITHTEIMHAVFRSNSRNAAFFIRDPSVIASLPGDMKTSFIESTQLGKESLSILKKQLRNRFPKQVFEYKCSCSGEDTSFGIKKVSLDGLDIFASKVIGFFKNAIEQFYPKSGEDLSSNDLNFLFQDIFLEKKGALLVGRATEREEMLKFICNPSKACEVSKNYLILIGPSGIGKSSLLANVVREIKASGLSCIYNFAGASPGSTVSTSVDNIFTTRLMSVLGIKPSNSSDTEQTEHTLRLEEVVQTLFNTEQQMTFVFDAVNQFSDDAAFNLKWLPQGLAGNLKCIITCTEDSTILNRITSALSERSYEEIKLEGFGEKERLCFIKTAFSRYKKRLDDDQMKQLMSAKEAFNPLWLSLACEELRIFGVFETLSEKITLICGTLHELVAAIIDRVISEDATKLLRDAICFLACCIPGLTETELRWCIGDGTEPLPLLTWKRCRLLLQPYLITSGRWHGEESFTFFHDSFNVVIKEQLLDNAEIKKSYHSKLSELFSKHCSDDRRVARELPTQLKLANQHAMLVEFLRKDKRSIQINSIARSLYLKDVRCTTFVRGENDVFCAPVYICLMCSVRCSSFSPMPVPTKSQCVVCGGMNHFQSKSTHAFVCMRHKDRNVSPGNAKCFVCKKIIFLNQKLSHQQLHTCQVCNSQGKKCVSLEKLNF